MPDPMSNGARSRELGRSFAGALSRARATYLRTSPRVRGGFGLVLLVAVGVLAATAGWPVLPTLALVVVACIVVALALSRPDWAATALVYVAWLASLPLQWLAYARPDQRSTARDMAALLVLGAVVAVLARWVRGFPPWQTAAAALLGAAVIGSLAVLVAPVVSVIPACVVAGGVLAYVTVARRRRGPAQQAYLGPPPARSTPASDGDPRYDDLAELPDVSVDEAMAELENMIGLREVKEQVRSIVASIEAARLRARAGYSTDKPMRHFVFLGPPGTGKTSVARVIATIFYAYRLLERPRLVEVQRSDLVADHLGGTALKTGEAIDRALGGVLFVDEAYSLAGTGDGQGDRFGAEAVQALVKRAEDDRDHIVIILAGYQREMESFLDSNPGLASRFPTRVRFPSYDPPELFQIAEHLIALRGDQLHPDAAPTLWSVCEDVCRRGVVDELGNGRFVRSLVEAAASARDVRAMAQDDEPAPEQLVTILPADVEHARVEVTARLRGYTEAPSLDDALAELDAMVGLDPVKRQVRTIVAQLRVARVRREQGLTAAPPMRHFVFLGPAGTGKTTVARVMARVFAALGVLSRPEVVEAHRVDLVGEYMGHTAAKTNALVDRALGGVLFIDEAYALVGGGYAHGDAFGHEAVATLLKRAEDDRDRLVVILAGYTDDMERLLASNQGLASRFSTRVAFPGYSGQELHTLALHVAERAGDRWDHAAVDELAAVFAEVEHDGRVDALGNGRFVRSLYEGGCAARDVRLAPRGPDVSAVELTTLTADDVRTAYDDLTERPP
ncbi:MAG: AAA family ATPase [Streptosporangiaceae bacterium]